MHDTGAASFRRGDDTPPRRSLASEREEDESDRLLDERLRIRVVVPSGDVRVRRAVQELDDRALLALVRIKRRGNRRVAISVLVDGHHRVVPDAFDRLDRSGSEEVDVLHVLVRRLDDVVCRRSADRERRSVDRDRVLVAVVVEREHDRVRLVELGIDARSLAPLDRIAALGEHHELQRVVRAAERDRTLRVAIDRGSVAQRRVYDVLDGHSDDVARRAVRRGELVVRELRPFRLVVVSNGRGRSVRRLPRSGRSGCQLLLVDPSLSVREHRRRSARSRGLGTTCRSRHLDGNIVIRANGRKYCHKG